MAVNNYTSSNLGLALTPQTEDDKLFDELFRIYNAIKVLAANLDNYTGILARPSDDWSLLTPADTIKTQNLARLYLIFSTAVSYGELVNIYDNAGVMTARKASAVDSSKPAHGVCFTSGGVANGAYGEVILAGLLPASGATIGATYYLSDTDGAFSATPGTVNQAVGFGLDDAVYLNIRQN